MANKTSQPEAPVAAIDPPSSSFERFLEENLRSLLIAGAVIFVGIMGYLVYTYLSDSAAAEEANAFTAAESVDEFRTVIQNYPGSKAAGNAQLMIGKTLGDGDDTKQEGISELRTFVESFPEHPLRPQGLFELGSLLLDEGSKTDAIGQFDKLISEYPLSHLTPYAKLCKGDFAYEDGRTDDAQAIYSDVLTSHSGTQAAQMAEQRIDRVKIDAPTIVAPRPESTSSGPDVSIPEPPPLLADPTSGETESGPGTEETAAGEGENPAETPQRPQDPGNDDVSSGA